MARGNTSEWQPGSEGLDPNRWRALAVIAIASLMIVLDASIINLALPSAQKALHISNANRQWVVTAYSLTFGSLLLLGGRIADFVGAGGDKNCSELQRCFCLFNHNGVEVAGKHRSKAHG